jgi:hypothetical protein
MYYVDVVCNIPNENYLVLAAGHLKLGLELANLGDLLRRRRNPLHHLLHQNTLLVLLHHSHLLHSLFLPTLDVELPHHKGGIGSWKLRGVVIVK